MEAKDTKYYVLSIIGIFYYVWVRFLTTNSAYYRVRNESIGNFYWCSFSVVNGRFTVA